MKLSLGVNEFTWKWLFKFSKTPAFRVNWNQPKGHPAIEIFLGKLEKEIFSVFSDTPLDHNLSKEEWLAMRGLAEVQNIIIMPAGKSYFVVVWDRKDYLVEADRQLQNNKIYESRSRKDADLVNPFAPNASFIYCFFAFGQLVKKNVMTFRNG